MARTTGLCSGATTTEVPRISVELAAARKARISSGSAIGMNRPGMCPEAE